METIRKKVKEIYDLSHNVFYDELVFEIDAEFYNLFVTLSKYYESFTIGIGTNSEWQWDNMVHISYKTKEEKFYEISFKEKFIDKNFSDLEKKICILLDKIIEKTKKLQKEKKRIKEEEKQAKLEKLRKEIQEIENS